MRPSNRRFAATAVALALAGLALVGGQAARGATTDDTAPKRGLAASSATFSDASGDSGTAPDITGLTVSDDDAGTITFRVELPNRPEPAPGFLLLIAVDADANPVTGGDGVEFLIGTAGAVVLLSRWNGSDFEFIAPASLTSAYVNSGVTVSINRADLGGTSGFLFGVATSDDGVDFDFAPELFMWPYEVGTQPPTPPPDAVAPPIPPEAGGPADAPEPAGPAVPLDTMGPRVRVLTPRLKVRRNRVVAIRLRCPASESRCTGKLRLETAKKLQVRSLTAAEAGKRKVVLGAKKFSLAGGRTLTVKVRLSKRNYRLIAGLKKVRVRATVTARDAAGNKRTTTRTIALKAPKPGVAR